MSVRPATSVAQNGPPPADAVSLATAEVMHCRLRPLGHRFTYRIFSVLVDVDRLADVGRRSALLSVGRFNLVSFHEADHGPADGTPLRPWVDRRLAEAGLSERPASVLLLACPRILGYVFNPLSVFFCFDAAGRCTALLYEVRNTFGGRHTYVAPVREGEATAAGIRQSRTKRFFVSPFLPMGLGYRFSVLPPGRAVRVRILEGDRAGPVLAATYAAVLQPLTTAALAGSLLKLPWVTLKIIAAIHFEALRLWLKGAPVFSEPVEPASRTGAAEPS